MMCTTRHRTNKLIYIIHLQTKSGLTWHGRLGGRSHRQTRRPRCSSCLRCCGLHCHLRVDVLGGKGTDRWQGGRWHVRVRDTARCDSQTRGLRREERARGELRPHDHAVHCPVVLHVWWLLLVRHKRWHFAKCSTVFINKVIIILLYTNFIILFLYQHVQSRLVITRLVITRIGYNAVSRGLRIYAAREKMGTTANSNAVITVTYLMKFSRLSCTGVTRNNLMIKKI